MYFFFIVYSFKDPFPWDWEDGNSDFTTQVKAHLEHLSICGFYSASAIVMFAFTCTSGVNA